MEDKIFFYKTRQSFKNCFPSNSCCLSLKWLLFFFLSSCCGLLFVFESDSDADTTHSSTDPPTHLCVNRLLTCTSTDID